MAVKSFLSLRVFTPILIVAAFFLGRFTASWPGSEAADAGNPSSASSARVAIPPGQNVVGFLDMVQGKPVVGAKRDGEVQLAGWAGCAAADSQLVKVQVLVDDKAVADAVLSYPRPDVAAAYGRPDFEKSGWKASFSAHGTETGEHALKAIVTCSKGETGVLPVFSLNVTKE
jgi:hypothetical protein